MSDAANAIGAVLMAAGFVVGASSVAFMHASNVGERHVRTREQDLDGADLGPFGIFLWMRHRDGLEVAARWSFWVFVVGAALSVGSSFLS